jgi:hypothetical protein
MSAARAEPDTIASAVASKTNFFMTIPITFQGQSDFPAPQGQQSAAWQFRNVAPIWIAAAMSGSKKQRHLLTF